MKIVVVQDGSDCNFFCCLSVLIGLKKKYPKSQITWIGNEDYFKLLKFNKRIDSKMPITMEIDFSDLAQIFKSDICINSSNTKLACDFARKTNADKYYGYLNGPINRDALFLQNLLSNNTRTNKHILDLYYALAGLKWSGEGFGLSYYPKTRQSSECGFMMKNKNIKNCESFCFHRDILKRLDRINKYRIIHTDNEFVAFASIALRKMVFYYSKPLPYKIQFFGRGEIKPFFE